MANGKHYILTRYNVASPGRWEEIRLRPNWLESLTPVATKGDIPALLKL